MKDNTYACGLLFASASAEKDWDSLDIHDRRLVSGHGPRY